MRALSIATCVALFFLSGQQRSFASTIPDIIPLPVGMKVTGGSWALTEQTIVKAGPGAEQEAQKLAAVLREKTSLSLPISTRATSSSRIALELDPLLSNKLGNEGYSLVVREDGAAIRAATQAGLFYGSVTFCQLLPAKHQGQMQNAAGGWLIPRIEIEDYPRFAWRGLLVDVARHHMPVEFLKKMVDLLAFHKLNTLQLHLTDDQGWRIEIRKHPRLAQIGSSRKESPVKGERDKGDKVPYGPLFYTQDQLRDLVAYARDRHVVIVPEFEMPGHFMAALAAYPEFSCRGGPFEVRTRWGIEPEILCVGNDKALDFVREVLAEIIEIFPGRFIHIGGDEAPRDRWKECPKCQARLRSEQLSSEAQLQTWLNSQVESFLAAHGRRLIGWDEILEGGLTPQAAVMSWRGIEGGLAAAGAGHDVVMSPTSHCYFDYAQASEPGEPESIGGLITLSKVYDFEPVPPGLDQAREHHILGAQGNVWTEFIRTPAELEYFAFPRAVALAEVLWSPSANRDFSGFQNRLRTHLLRLDELKVNYRPLEGARRSP
jgi:hexosaminidase